MTRIDHQQNADGPTPPDSIPVEVDSKVPVEGDGSQAKPSPARRPGRGGKLRLEPEEIQSHPVAGAWLESVRRIVGDDDLEWGLRTARAGRVRTLVIAPGLVSASVSEEGEGGRRVMLTVPMLADDAWNRVEKRMAGEAVWTARLTEGEFPPNLASLFNECGLSLAPGPEEVISCRINGPSSSGNRRAAAVAWLAAERYTNEPLLMLETRGRGLDQIVERIRRRRVLDLTGGATAHPDPVLLAELETPAPLSENVEHFWRGEHDSEGVHTRSPGQHVPHALLRRLGPSTMDGKFPLAGLLATIYDLVSERSREILDDCDE